MQDTFKEFCVRDSDGSLYGSPNKTFRERDHAVTLKTYLDEATARREEDADRLEKILADEELTAIQRESYEEDLVLNRGLNGLKLFVCEREVTNWRHSPEPAREG